MSFLNCFSCLQLQQDVITKLDYSSSALQSFPQEIFEYNKKLETLILSSNHLTEISQDLLHFQFLKVLNLHDNEIELLPNNFGILRQLQKLDLSRNSIRHIPESLKQCKYLKRLDLSMNNIQHLPDAITSLVQLDELLLNETFLEFLPNNIGQLINLKILELRSNNLISLPKSIGLLTSLSRLDIGANEFNELPEVIGNLNQLQELWIDFNKISYIPVNYSNLIELIHLEANSNHLKALPNEISNWKNLQVLSLSHNEMKELPFSIGMLKNLITLKCDRNHLKELPDSICNLKNIEELILNNNFLIRLPKTIGNLKKLRYLELDENFLRSLPSELSYCHSLTVLSVHSNKLNELPNNIDNLVELKVLNIVNNMLSFLPSSILRLQNLRALWLHNNQSQPLIPLQYKDENQSNFTCCFLLQQTYEDKKKQTYVLTNERTYENIDRECDDNIISSKIHIPPLEYQNSRNQCHQQLPHINFTKRKESTLRIKTSPSKKICFADEKYLSDFEMEKKDCKITNSLADENLTSKLMRSPTPYPKELRIMAKLVRNQEKEFFFHNQNSDSRGVIDHFSILASEKVNLKTNTNLITQKKNNQEPNENQIILTYSNMSTSTNLLQKEEIDNQNHFEEDRLKLVYDSYIRCHQEYNNSYLVDDNHVNSHDISESLLKNIEIKKHENYNLTINNNKYLSSEKSVVLRICAINKSPGIILSNVDLSLSMCTLPLTDTIQNTKTIGKNKIVYEELGIINQVVQTNSNTNISSPPPYYVAKNYTKKSKEDLLKYDNMRNINLSFQNNRDISVKANIENCGISLNENQNYTEKINNVKNDENVNNSDNNLNNSNHNIYNFLNKDHLKKLDINEDVRENNLTLAKHDDIKTSNSVMIDSSIESNYIPISKLNKNPNKWLFGVHKNPTVKQVFLTKNANTGFEIKRIKCEGIFIRSILSNTEAADLLKIDDKILDVDGRDFTKLDVQEANKVLLECGPTLNIMISRK